MNTWLRYALAGGAALLLAACGDDAGVSEALSRDYCDCSTSSAEPAHLTVTCRNSPFAARPDAERAKTARKIAEYVRDHHPKYKGVEDVTVAVLDKKEPEPVLDVRNLGSTYTFTAAELGAAQP
jgi:hypothetical protein